MKTKKCSLSITTLIALSLILTTSPCHAYFGENSDEATSSSSMAAIIAGSAIAGIAGLALAFGNFFGKNSPSKNTVTYNPDGANFGTAPVDSTIHDKGSTPKVLGNSGYLGKPGFEFLGWSIDPNATKAQYAPGENIDSLVGSLVLYPIFGASITYKDTSGAIGNPPIDNDKYVENYPATVSDQGSLSRTSYFFQGWSITDNSTSLDYRPGDKIIIPETGDLTLYAVWSLKPWSVKYYSNGASGDVPVEPVFYDSNETVKVLGNTNLIKTGFHFSGWNTECNVSDPVYQANNSISISSNLTLCAMWTCNIKYHPNGNNTTGSVPTDLNNYINGSSAFIANQGDLSNKGYYFKGWLTNSSASIGDYTPGTNTTMTGNLDLYAIWNAKPYSITYNSNNQTRNVTGNVPAATMYYDAKDENIPILGNTASESLANPGLTFSGWSIDPNAHTTEFENNVMLNISDNITLYAIWTSNIVYDRNGADNGTTPINNASYTYNETATLSDGGNLTRANYHIGGWQYDNDTDAYNLSQRVTMEKNLYFTVKWIENPYFITYCDDGADKDKGTVPVDNGLYNTNDNATILNSAYPLIKTGYVFMGWSTEASPTTVQYIAGDLVKGNITFGYNNITLHPVWGGKITYNANAIRATGDVPTNNTTYILNSTAIALDKNSLDQPNKFFHGWTTNPLSNNVSYLPGDSINMTGNLTLYAVWSSSPCIVQYQANNISGGTLPVDNHSYNINDNATILSINNSLAPIYRNNYHFDHWINTANNSTYQPGGNIIIGNNTTNLQAAWINNQVIYNGNNATNGTTPNDITSHKNGDAVTLLNNTFDSGYIFQGWDENPNATNATYQPNGTFNFTFNSSHVIPYKFFAIWRYVMIMYKTTGVSGSVTPGTKVYSIGENITLANTSTLSSNITPVIVWNTKSDGTGDSYKSGDNFIISNNTIMYAKLIQVGTSYGGGTVIAIGNGTDNITDPKKILIMANEDQTSNSSWAAPDYQSIQTNATNGYYNKTNITSCPTIYTCNTIGSGQANVALINGTIGIANASAAQAAANCTDGDYHDWYLPSMWELNAMNSYISIPGRCNGAGQSTCMDSNYYYWSSTECNYQQAWDQSFNITNGGAQVDGYKHAGMLSVRAVRNEDY